MQEGEWGWARQIQALHEDSKRALSLKNFVLKTAEASAKSDKFALKRGEECKKGDRRTPQSDGEIERGGGKI